jgi:DNA polymerase-4
MAVAIKQRVTEEQGLCASIGIAPCKIVAKVASDYSKPDGLVEVEPGRERDFLFPLPVGRLPGIGKQAQKRLKELGVTTVGQLASLPLKTLNRYFGISGTTMHNTANGIDNRKVELPGTAKSISRETTFREDTKNGEFLKSTLRYLGEKVGEDLRRREKRAKCVTLKIRFSDFTTSTRSQTLQQPFDSNEIIFNSGARLLEKAMQAEKQPVRLLGIGVSGIVEPVGQMSMLDTNGQRLVQLNKTIDGIRDKFGFSSIQTGRTLLLRDIYTVQEK